MNTDALNNKKRDPNGECKKLVDASRGNLGMGLCMINYMSQSVLSMEERRIEELKNKLNNDMANTQNFRSHGTFACKNGGCDVLTLNKIKIEAEADWYCAAKMDKECNESMINLRDIVSQLAVYRC